jgi:DNA-binding transcriptional ArsR family regulator
VNGPLPEIAAVDDRRRAVALLAHPIRSRILALAAEPSSATEIAARLDLPRQRVNYHVRKLADARFLLRAGRVRKRNLVEQRYVASARAYVVAPGALGPIAASARLPEDALSAGRLVALAGRMQADVMDAVGAAAHAGRRLPTLSMAADVRFERAEQREAFAAALQAAVTDVIGRFSSPSRTASGAEGQGRPYRLVLGCYPAPPVRQPTRKQRGPS